MSESSDPFFRPASSGVNPDYLTLEELNALIQRAEVRAEKAEDNVEKARKSVHELDAESRRWIAKLIITGFLAAIGGVILLLALLASLGIPDARWNTFADKTLEILKNVLLPVVTLILGYYFGQSSKSGD